MEEREFYWNVWNWRLDRIPGDPGEDFQEERLLPWKEYFTTVAKFLLLIRDTRQFLEQEKTEHCHWKN